MCSLPLEKICLTVERVCFALLNNFLTVKCVCFASTIILYCCTFSLHLENNFLITERVRFPLKTIFFLSNVFASLQQKFLLLSELFVLVSKEFSYYRMCSLRFEKNFLSIECVRFENNFLTIERVRFALKIISLLLNVFVLLWYRRKPHYRSICLLSFRYRCHF
jgi:hypothetical protein